MEDEDSVTVAAGLLPDSVRAPSEPEEPDGEDVDAATVAAGSFLDAVKANDKEAIAAIFRLLMD